ncbi:MAG: Ig-like domain-containing protein [Bacteroidota bacterium]
MKGKFTAFTLLLFLLVVKVVSAQETNCNDNIDNDNDGLVDCQDPDCPSCDDAIICAAPYVYHMPPIYGSKTSTGLYDDESFLIATLARAANVQVMSPDGTLITTLNVPVANPIILPVSSGAATTTIPRFQITLDQTDNDGGGSDIVGTNTVLNGKGLIFESDQPLQITYSHKSRTSNNNQDILQLQGRAALGFSFYAASETLLDNDNTVNDTEKHFVSVLATEDNTNITFTLPTNPFTGAPLVLAGVPAGTTTINITLNAGQSYIIASRNRDRRGTVTGTRITTDKPVVVNSGAQHVPTAQGDDRDAGFQQLVPAKALEDRYIVIDGGNNDTDGAGVVRDYLIILSIENNTTFTVNGVSGGVDGAGNAVPTTLNAGEYFTYVFDNTNFRPYLIEGSNRLYVFHATSRASSEMGLDILPPIDECIGSRQIDFEKTGDNANAVILVPTSGLSSLRFRGGPYTNFAANIDPDGPGPLPAAQANSAGSGYSYVIINNANILATNNRVTCDEKFHLGVYSRTGGTGNYAYISNYEKSIEVLDPVTFLPTSGYVADQIIPGEPIEHCLLITGCGASNSITEAVANGWGGPGTEGTVTIEDGCIIYTMDPNAPSCAREIVTVSVQNEFEITSQVCLRFENITRPFTVGNPIPSNPFICTVGSPNTINVTVPVEIPSGTPTYTWLDPDGIDVSATATNAGTNPDFTTAITADKVGIYQLTVTVGTCSQTVDVNVAGRDCDDNDGDGINDVVDLDDDNDGIPDLVEQNGIDPLADADGDGISNYLDDTPGGTLPPFEDTNSDGVNDFYDTDLDGIINSFDLDSENDGIPDVIEAGGVDEDGNGIIDNFTDTDNDGLSQNVDANNSGAAGSGDGLGNPDQDGDGIPNTLDLDADNDGIPDIIEAGGIDSNNDGIVDVSPDNNANGLIDVYDGNTLGTPLTSTGQDTNNDGRPDSYLQDNIDRDGQPNFLDIDADNDGIIDFIEAGIPDSNNDGQPDGSVGTDGWSDAVDALADLNLPNADSEGLPDYLDIDADNDGIPDNIEGQATTGYIAPANADNDNDGLDDAYDNDDATPGGNANNGIQPVNTNGGDAPDYTDTDSDNDGFADVLEGWDTDGNNVLEGSEITAGTIDTDGDGLLDSYDENDVVHNPTNGTTPLSYPDVDDPGGDRDWRAPVNLPPLAEDDTNTAAFDTPTTGTLSDNDSEPDGDLLVYTDGTFSTTNGGTITINPDGSYTYTPPTGFTGIDCYTYTVCDDRTPPACSQADVCISIGENLPPIAVDDTTSTISDTDVSGTLADNDEDPEGQPLTYNDGTFSTTNGGTITIDTDGNYTYTPPAGFTGTDCYLYTVCDPIGACDQASVCIEVNPSPIYIPEGFSPNNDGINDFFIIDGTDGRTLYLRIFNRWGNIIYESEDYLNNWDGTSNRGLRVGEMIPDGTYFYIAEFDSGERFSRYITIKR